MSAPHIHVDASTFEPWKIQALTHSLVDHPLLQIDALVELGKRQQERNLVRTHSADATAGTSFADAPNLHPNQKGAATTLADIANARAWMSLLNVQADPIYRAFIDEVLDSVKPVTDVRDPGMCYRAGWIFVSSPNAITPFHMDHEHNFIMQIRGTKRLYTWDPFDRTVVSERAQELFHDKHSRELVTWSEDWRKRARVLDLVP
ncbi:MAG TPA: cupin-like domain-containing protein, partial [Kofleriaceae bacterium]